ncbi:hypothetical protein JDV02_004461 [Purpureocillium takamizusanense]|uniref:Uncharacterized protein n=1 Tax=Purpureocillium takamizusanense TaxID=2060973 RepID=A0A9Q8QFA0_9HYPO|nr:uncharacterized protein JDV02_004461 [Purpureocillium takamizusanense]UNI18177.1 hypothetical protein JDV02_004461 [Purpureocillium takamizusanense]
MLPVVVLLSALGSVALALPSPPSAALSEVAAQPKRNSTVKCRPPPMRTSTTEITTASPIVTTGSGAAAGTDPEVSSSTTGAPPAGTDSAAPATETTHPEKEDDEDTEGEEEEDTDKHPSGEGGLLAWVAPPSNVSVHAGLEGCNKEDLQGLSLADQARRCGTGNICRALAEDPNAAEVWDCFEKFEAPPTRPTHKLPWKEPVDDETKRVAANCNGRSASEDICGTGPTCARYNNRDEHDDMYRTPDDCLASHYGKGEEAPQGTPGGAAPGGGAGAATRRAR